MPITQRVPEAAPNGPARYPVRSVNTDAPVRCQKPSIIRTTLCPLCLCGEISRLICFDLSSTSTVFLILLFDFFQKQLLVEPVGMWTRGPRVWSTCGLRRDDARLDFPPFGAVHELSTRLCSGRSAPLADSPTYPQALAAPCGCKRVGSGHGQADCDGGSC